MVIVRILHVNHGKHGIRSAMNKLLLTNNQVKVAITIA